MSQIYLPHPLHHPCEELVKAFLGIVFWSPRKFHQGAYGIDMLLGTRLIGTLVIQYQTESILHPFEEAVRLEKETPFFPGKDARL
jgi:hypothetical protein